MEAENPRAVIGANNPPDPLITEAAERIETANRWLSERKEITDAEMADKLSFFISQADATFKALDEQRLQEGRDFKTQQEKKYAPLQLLKLVKERLVPLRTAWLNKEQARVDAEAAEAQKKIDEAKRVAEEAARRAEEEAAKDKGGNVLQAEAAAAEAQAAIVAAEKAAGAVPERAQIKGTFTHKAVGLRAYWGAEITDFNAAFKTYKKRPEVVNAIKEAMEKVAKADAQKLKDADAAPAGVKFTMEMR